MTTADLRPTILDIPMTQGDDLAVQFTFGFSLTGYTGWTANAQPVSPDTGTLLPFTIDATQQASGIITITLPAASTNVFTEARWALRLTNPSGQIFTAFAGAITPAEEPF